MMSIPGDSLERVYSDIENDPNFEHLRRRGSQLVPGIGLTEYPPLMFVGEAPGAQEDRKREPFVGAAGRVLSNLLAEIPLTREQVFITNVLKYRPTANRDPVADEKKHSLVYLMREISIVKPRLVALLGKHALTTFFPKEKISEVHGDIVRGRFVALYHPAIVVYDSGKRGIMVADFRKLVQHLETTQEWPNLPPRTDVDPSQV